MKNNNLTPNKGLSLSQAQSVSNLCNQKASSIEDQLSIINNYSKKITVEGGEHILQEAHEMPENIVELLKTKANLHACQAFLMENIKAKDLNLKKIKGATPILSDLVVPQRPKSIEINYLDEVDEDWGWEQLSAKELNEYLEAEAYASHIGQFIHKRSKLDALRRELPTVPTVEWMEIEVGKKSPVTISKHHSPETLLKVHEELAALHRDYEQRVNYFKAKVKNLVTKENARIANVNADAINKANEKNAVLGEEFQKAHKEYQATVMERRAKFENARQEEIREIASMRISVDPRFQETIDGFLSQLNTSQED